MIRQLQQEVTIMRQWTSVSNQLPPQGDRRQPQPESRYPQQAGPRSRNSPTEREVLPLRQPNAHLSPPGDRAERPAGTHLPYSFGFKRVCRMHRNGRRPSTPPQAAHSIRFGGLIEGRNIEIISNRRIVQAWRPTSWDSGVYSVVHFELKASASGTTLALDHTGFPQGGLRPP